MSEVIDIPARLRALRERWALTQRDLARRTGLAHTTIAKIERGEISPTVASLQKIAASFQMPLTALLDASADAPQPIFFGRDDLTVVAIGQHTMRQVGSNLSRRALQMLESTWEVGADSGPTTLGHAGEEAGFVIRGKLEVTVGDATRVLGPGEAYCFESRVPHRFRNAGDEACVVVSAATPPSL